MKATETREDPCADGACAGALVRTRRRWAGGVARAEVSRRFLAGDETYAEVAGRTYPVSALEVIRPPVVRAGG